MVIPPSYHWDGEHFFITTLQAQICLQAEDAVRLLETLYNNKEEIFRRVNAHNDPLPDWAQPDAPREEDSQVLPLAKGNTP